MGVISSADGSAAQAAADTDATAASDDATTAKDKNKGEKGNTEEDYICCTTPSNGKCPPLRTWGMIMGGMMAAIGFGISISFGLFVEPITEELGINRESISLAVSQTNKQPTKQPPLYSEPWLAPSIVEHSYSMRFMR